MNFSAKFRLVAATALLFASPLAHAMERVTLNTGFAIDCVRREPLGDRIRLYLAPTAAGAEANYLDVGANAIVTVESIPDPPPLPTAVAALKPAPDPTVAELHEMLSHAGTAHHIDAELLASLVHAESGYHAHAVSRTGAQGLMQLMPGTAAAVGVHDAFVPSENVEGGTSYFDAMLTRYHDNIALALAAYNAGPGAVDRFHGVPPYRETRAYVARVIREFNERKNAALGRESQRHATILLAKGQ